MYTRTKCSCWNRQVFKTVSGSSGETQVSSETGGTADTQQKNLEIFPEVVPLNFEMKQDKGMVADGHCDYEFLNHTFSGNAS